MYFYLKAIPLIACLALRTQSVPSLTSATPDIIYFPVRIHDNESGGTVDVELSVDTTSGDGDAQILQFCEEHKVQESFCKVLNDAVASAIDERRTLMVPLPNSHLIRHEAAVRAEQERLFSMDESFDFSRLQEAEDAAVQAVLTRWGGTQMQRVAFIHSCVLSEDTAAATRVLRDMLQQLQDYGLAAALDSIVVLNYGYPLPEEITTEHAHSGKVAWVQVHESTVFFEVPSLRVLHRLSQHLRRSPTNAPSTAGDAQILYLHTKGTSYQQAYAQIEDWRDMMLYFAAGRHASARHLLQSGEVDCVGVNFKSHPRPILSGNFWWSTAAHLAALPALQHRTAGKYEAETWVLGRAGVRVYVMHSSNVNHAVSAYPPLCYAEEAHGVAPRTRPHHAHLAHLPLQRVDDLCGGPRTVREARRFWQLL